MKAFRRRQGFTLIELLIVIAVIAIIAAIAIPNLLTSRKTANETSAIGSMKAVNTAEATYRSRVGYYSDLAGMTGYIEPALVTKKKSGYTFTWTVGSDSTTGYFVYASPSVTGSGDRVFYTDESGTIWSAGSGTTAPTTDTSGATPGASWSQIGN